jgi:hypothetical protein
VPLRPDQSAHWAGNGLLGGLPRADCRSGGRGDRRPSHRDANAGKRRARPVQRHARSRSGGANDPTNHLHLGDGKLARCTCGRSFPSREIDSRARARLHDPIDPSRARCFAVRHRISDRQDSRLDASAVRLSSAGYSRHRSCSACAFGRQQLPHALHTVLPPMRAMRGSASRQGELLNSLLPL